MAASGKQNILIIGGSRFVGPLLLKLMISRGNNLTVFNRGLLQSEYPSKVNFIKGDRNKRFNLKERFDAVIDMCAFNGKQIEGALRELRFDFFLHFSTAAVYKKTEIFPLTEESPIGQWPLWDNYNKGKIECEKALSSSGVKYASIRPVYILGPKNYIARELFIYRRIFNNQPLVLPGDGQAKVQFVFAKEVAKSIAEIAQKQAVGAFNCVGNEVITLENLVKEMAKIVQKKPMIHYHQEENKEKFDPLEFPFPNENLIASNKKIKELGIEFTPLVKELNKDYENYYRHVI